MGFVLSPSPRVASRFFSASEPLFRHKLSTSAVQFEVSANESKSDDEFLPWLRQKAGHEISSVLSVGMSRFGRSLFASKSIKAGDCLMKVPYNVHITQDVIACELKSSSLSDVDNIARIASILLVERKFPQESEWEPYIRCLPSVSEMHCTIFWDPHELEMVRPSKLFQDTLTRKAVLEESFTADATVLNHLQKIGDCRLEDFMHAYALVESRAWETSKGISLIPFADFCNHDANSQSFLLSDDNNSFSEVFADRDYSPGEEVLINYGNFSNASLMLDFGFALPLNLFDQVDIWIEIPSKDPLHSMKLEILQKLWLLTAKDAYSFSSSGCFFKIKEVKLDASNCKGLSPALRALARVLSATSAEVLTAMENEAVDNDGRLARLPFKDRESEVSAHTILLSRFERQVQEHEAALQRSLESTTTITHGDTKRFRLRKQMARDLLEGELRVLRSAASWLTNYCSSLST